MKKLIIAILAFALILCLAGCIEVSKSNESNETKPKEESTSNVYIWIDKKTGVQYIVYSYKCGYSGMGGITPRLNADGTLYTEEGK